MNPKLLIPPCECADNGCKVKSEKCSNCQYQHEQWFAVYHDEYIDKDFLMPFGVPPSGTPVNEVEFPINFCAVCIFVRSDGRSNSVT